MHLRLSRFRACLAFLALLPLVPARADDSAGDRLGRVHFEVTGQPAAREHVVRGVKLLHHMMYPEADRAFAAALTADPSCALGYWGRAMTLLHPLWPDAPTATELREGEALLKQGLALPPATPRERAYLETLARYFVGAQPEQHVERLKALDEAASAQADAYPEDLDAEALAALFHLAPARFQPKDTSHRIQIRAAERLQRVLAALPDHPGAQHYKIHAYDFPMLADRALEVCEDYGAIAPEVPHALHMPSHIYTRRGQWEKSVDFNRRSAEAARQLMAKDREVNSHLPHALDYMVYAYCQQGRFARAEQARHEMLALKGPYSPVQRAAMAFAFAAIPARCALERQRWEEAAALPVRAPAGFSWGDAFLNCDSITRFARALGAARSGRLQQARRETAALETLLTQLSIGKRAAYWRSQAETQLLAARAWIHRAEGNDAEAIALMQRAAALEAQTDKEAVTPGEVLPAGELLGDLLLECDRPAEALAAYQAVDANSPNRLNTLYGAGVAARKAGQPDLARTYFQRLLEITRDADPGLPQVQEARRHL